MKRGINFYELFFLGLLFLKGTETHFFGGVPSWLEVLTPLFILAVVIIIENAAKFYSLEEKLRFYFWKVLVKTKASKARKTAEKEFKDAYLKGKAAANPGQHYDK